MNSFGYVPPDATLEETLNGFVSAILGEGMGAAFLIIFSVVLILLSVVFLIWALAVYIINGIALHCIAKRRGIRNPWLSWLPVGNVWVLGSISDQYQKLAKNNDTGRRKLLVGLTVFMFALLFVYETFTVLSGPIVGLSETPVLIFSIAALLADLAYMIVAIIASVIQYMAIFDLYRSCSPKWAVLYLVLTLFVSVSMPVLLLLCLKKDDGLPKKEV